MKKYYVILAAMFLLQAGCSVAPLQIAIKESNRLSSRADIPLYAQASEQIGFSFSHNQKDNYCRVKYHPSFSENRWMVVEGRLANGKSYPLVLDTGASPALFVTDIHILENKLPIYPLGGEGETVGWGICDFPELQIGDFMLAGTQCMYREQHIEFQLFGLPVAIDKAIIAGLPLLRKFKYVSFDSVRKEAEFSFDSGFEPAEPTAWTQYNFEIEEDLSGNSFLFVMIPVAGIETKLQLDTGSGRGLAIGNTLWNKIRDKLQDVKLRKDKELYPYIGWLDCRKGYAATLAVGNRTVYNAQIAVFADDSPLIEDCSGLIGMQYFEDTAIVIDFGKNKLWVQRQQTNEKKLALDIREPVLSF